MIVLSIISDLVSSAASTEVSAAGAAGATAMLLGSTGGIGFFRGGDEYAAPDTLCDFSAIGLLYMNVDDPSNGGGKLWACTDGGWVSTSGNPSSKAPTPAPTSAPTPAPTNAPTPAPTNAPPPAIPVNSWYQCVPGRHCYGGGLWEYGHNQQTCLARCTDFGYNYCVHRGGGPGWPGGDGLCYGVAGPCTQSYDPDQYTQNFARNAVRDVRWYFVCMCLGIAKLRSFIHTTIHAGMPVVANCIR